MGGLEGAFSPWPPAPGCLRKHCPVCLGGPEQPPASGGFTPRVKATLLLLRSQKRVVWGYCVLQRRSRGKISPVDELATTAMSATARMGVAPTGCWHLSLGSLIPSTPTPPQPKDACPAQGERPKGGTATAPGNPKAQLLPAFKEPFAKESLETAPGSPQMPPRPALPAQRALWAGAGMAGQGLDETPEVPAPPPRLTPNRCPCASQPCHLDCEGLTGQGGDGRRTNKCLLI